MQNKRSSILTSATEVFAKKGFEQATISEIGKGARVSPSGIYSFFSSKEEILFAIIEDFLVASIDGLKDHLEGIKGTHNKLRKALWFHCKAYSSSREEIQIILESRSYPRFYTSRAYEKLKQYSRIFITIIKDGIDEKSLHNISSAHVLRDMILGTVDHVAINWTMKNGPCPLEIAEQIFVLIANATACKDKEVIPIDKKELKRKQIINVATHLFAISGYKNTSMAEIARTAGVSEGTIYEYFRNKENLLISIPENKLGKLLAQLDGNELKDELQKTIHTIFKFHSENRDYSTVLVLMLRPNRNFYYSESNEIIKKIFAIIKKYIAAGQNRGMFRQNLDPSVYKALLFGSIDHVIIPWIIFNRDYNLDKVGNEVSKLFISAISCDRPPENGSPP